MVQELEELASEGLQFFDYHIRDNGEEPDKSELYPDNPHVHHNPGADESDSPIVVTGTAGTGTRVANDIFEHAGKVFMGGRRNAQRDSTEFDDYVKKYVEEILQVTKGKLNYEISDIPSHLAEKIRKGIETFDSVMTKERHNAGMCAIVIHAKFTSLPPPAQNSEWPLGMEGEPSDVFLSLLV